MVFTPAPARTTSERAGAASKTSAVTCLPRTTRTRASRRGGGELLHRELGPVLHREPEGPESRPAAPSGTRRRRGSLMRPRVARLRWTATVDDAWRRAFHVDARRTLLGILIGPR